MTTSSVLVPVRLALPLIVVTLLVPTSPASATHGESEARSLDPACEGAPDVVFSDEDVMTAEERRATDCIGASEYGPVTEGFDDGTYRPRARVQRGRMASFVARFLETAGVAMPSEPADAFDDDDDYPDVHEQNINRLAAIGVAEGDANGNYNPRDPISRQQMASLIRRGIEKVEGISLSEPEEDLFPGSCAQPHEQNVEALAHHHIVQGNADGEFMCGSDVSRGQMSLFLARGLALLADEGVIRNRFQETGTQPEPEEGSNQTYRMSPSSGDLHLISTGATDNRGRRAYLASRLDPGKTYAVVLLPEEKVDIASDGFVTIRTNEPNGGDHVSIETVNGETEAAAGSPTATSQVTGVDPQDDGQIAFEIDATGNEEVTPLVYLDEDGDGRLDFDSSNGVPTEPFATGGAMGWIPPEASSGEHQNVTVEGVNTELDYFVADDATYYYDDNDEFDGADNPEEFEQQLNSGDVLDVSYASDPAETSRFTFDPDGGGSTGIALP